MPQHLSLKRRLDRSLSIWVSLAVIAAVIFSVPGVRADKARPLDLEIALKTAASLNSSLKQVMSRYKSAKARVDAAMSAFFPKLNLDLSLSRSNNPVYAFGSKLNQASFTAQDFQLDVLNDPGYRTNWQTRFVLTQPIFNQGKEYIGYKISKVGKDIAALNETATRQSVFFMVEGSYFQVLLAIRALKVLDDTLKTAKAHERLAQKRYKSGLVLKSDLLNALVHRTETERQRFRAQSNLYIAIAALNRAMGTPQDTLWDIKPVSDTGIMERRGVKYWIETAMHHRPELLIGEKKLEMAKYRKKGAEFTFLPSVNLQGIYQKDTNNLSEFGGDSWTFMATVSFNIFNGLGDKADLASALAEKQAAEQGLIDTRGKIELEVRQAYYDLHTALKQLEVTRSAVAQAKESVKILKNRYENGMALMVELLSADTVLENQELQQAKARFNARITLSRLKLSSGVLGQDLHGESQSVDLQPGGLKTCAAP